MERLQKSTSTYVKWIARRGEGFEDKEKGLPIAFVGRMMISVCVSLNEVRLDLARWSKVVRSWSGIVERTL